MLTILCQLFHHVTAAVAAETDTKTAERVASLPFYLRPTQVLGFEVYPVTLAISFIVGLIIMTSMSKSNKTSMATASHILLGGLSDETREKMEQIKKQIGNDPVKFANAAAQYSACPSGKSSGGSLGTFSQVRCKLFVSLSF